MLISSPNKICLLILYTVLLQACAYMPGTTSVSTPNIDAVVAPEGFNSAISAAKNSQTDAAIKQLISITLQHQMFAPAHTNLGLQYLKQKKYTLAENALNKAISLNSNEATAYNHLGVISRIKGDFEQAESMYRQAINSRSEYANAHLNLGILLDMYMHQLPEALEHYQSYQSITKDSDALVAKWIIDIQRRIKSNNRKDS